MITWQCNCTGDPVAECTAALLPAILAADPAQDQDWEKVNRLLQASQGRLVERVCSSCCKGTSVGWVNTYVEIEESLSSRLPSFGTSANRLFLSKPAALELKQADVDQRHTTLFESLGPVPQPWWLTMQLAAPNAPSVTVIEPTSLSATYDGLNYDGLNLTSEPAKPVYEAFFEKLGDYVYVHIAAPCRNALAGVVGPAGVYLLLRKQADAHAPVVHPCLLAHLRTFLQSIVTAHLWSLTEHMRKRVEAAAAPFALHRDHLQALGRAAEQLLVVVDPVGVDTEPFDVAQMRAHAMFPEECHDVQAWWGEKEKARVRLAELAKQLGNINAKPGQERSLALVKAIGAAIEQALGQEGDDGLLTALRHAKALDHHSVCLELLKAGGRLRTLRAAQPTMAAQPTHGDGAQARDAAKDRFLREAVVQLYGCYRQQLDIADENDTTWLKLKFDFDVKSLVDGALALIDGRPMKIGGGLGARDLAPVLRGLAGRLSDGELESWRSALASNDDHKNVIIIRVGTRSEEAQEVR